MQKANDASQDIPAAVMGRIERETMVDRRVVSRARSILAEAEVGRK